MTRDEANQIIEAAARSSLAHGVVPDPADALDALVDVIASPDVRLSDEHLATLVGVAAMLLRMGAQKMQAEFSAGGRPAAGATH